MGMDMGMSRVMVGMCVFVSCLHRTSILPHDGSRVWCTVIRYSNTRRNDRLVQRPLCDRAVLVI